MANTALMRCDGCGQNASPKHVAKRLQRLEWSTRFRPVHINALLLAAFPPEADSEFLYAAPEALQGDAARLLDALGVPYTGKAADTARVDFQRQGFFLVHVLECSPESEASTPSESQALLEQRLPALFARIRRSLKPRRVVLVSSVLESLAKRFVESELGCPVLLDRGKPFDLEGIDPGPAIVRLKAALSSPAASPL